MLKKARVREYERLAGALLHMVGGVIGEKGKEGNKILIGIHKVIQHIRNSFDVPMQLSMLIFSFPSLRSDH